MLNRTTILWDVVNDSTGKKSFCVPMSLGNTGLIISVMAGFGYLWQSWLTVLTKQELVSSHITKDPDTVQGCCSDFTLSPASQTVFFLSFLQLVLFVLMLIASYLQDGVPKCVCFRLKEERRNGMKEGWRDERKGVRKEEGKEGWREERLSLESLGVSY